MSAPRSLTRKTNILGFLADHLQDELDSAVAHRDELLLLARQYDGYIATLRATGAAAGVPVAPPVRPVEELAGLGPPVPVYDPSESAAGAHRPALAVDDMGHVILRRE